MLFRHSINLISNNSNIRKSIGTSNSTSFGYRILRSFHNTGTYVDNHSIPNHPSMQTVTTDGLRELNEEMNGLFGDTDTDIDTNTNTNTNEHNGIKLSKSNIPNQNDIVLPSNINKYNDNNNSKDVDVNVNQSVNQHMDVDVDCILV